jgi:hypothetical protein
MVILRENGGFCPISRLLRIYEKPAFAACPAMRVVLFPNRKQVFLIRKEKCKFIGIARRVYKPDCDTIFIRST